MVRIEEVRKHKMHPNIPSETQALRDMSVQWLDPVIRRLHRDGILKDIESLDDMKDGMIEPLIGGIKSAAYCIRIPENEIVIKFDLSGFQVESEWLNEFVSHGVDVPKVYLIGNVDEENQSSGKFIVLECINGEDGKIAKTGREIKGNQSFHTKVSRIMGVELAKMHRAKATKRFGVYEDNVNSGFTTDTWQEYLIRAMKFEVLKEAGVNEIDAKKLVDAINLVEFPTEGIYISGDFALHNILVESMDPPKIKIIDPVGIIGDPYYDLATQYNIEELRNRLKDIRKKENLDINEYPMSWVENDPLDFQAFMDSYIRESGVSIEINRLNANQIVAMVNSYERRKKNISPNLSAKMQRSIDLEMRARKELIREKIQTLIR